MPNRDSRGFFGTGAGRNRWSERYASTAERRLVRRYSQTSGDWWSAGHGRGYRRQYLQTGLPRWARKWSGRCWSFWTQDKGAEQAELERIADDLEDKLAAVKARLESIDSGDRTDERENDTSAGQEQ